jgi:hypothetical protein
VSPQIHVQVHLSKFTFVVFMLMSIYVEFWLVNYSPDDCLGIDLMQSHLLGTLICGKKRMSLLIDGTASWITETFDSRVTKLDRESQNGCIPSPLKAIKPKNHSNFSGILLTK